MKSTLHLCATMAILSLVSTACSSSTSASGQESGGNRNTGATHDSGGTSHASGETAGSKTRSSSGGLGGKAAGASGSDGRSDQGGANGDDGVKSGPGGATANGGKTGGASNAGRDASAATDASAGGSLGGGGKGSNVGGAHTSGDGGPSSGAGGELSADSGRIGLGGSKADGGPVAATSCSRDLLKSTVEAYFKALAAHDPSSLPLADNVKATENGKAIKVGQDGLWKGAGKLEYVHTAYDERTEDCDTVCCTAVSEAALPDASKEIVVALRLKLVDQKISEIETIAPHDSNDYMLGPDGKALAASDKVVHWETAPSGKAATRKEMTDWINRYFSTFPNGFCDFSSDCKRLENGADANLQCTAGGQCGTTAGSQAMKPRNLMADETTGIGVGWTMFSGQYTDVHMIKMYDGKIHSVSAILSKASSSGW